LVEQQGSTRLLTDKRDVASVASKLNATIRLRSTLCPGRTAHDLDCCCRAKHTSYAVLVGTGWVRISPARNLPTRVTREPPDFVGLSWCCRTGLNCRPLPYQGSALPLSYGSEDHGAACTQSGGAAGGGANLPQGLPGCKDSNCDRCPMPRIPTQCAQVAFCEPPQVARPCLPLCAGAAITDHDQGRINRRLDEAGRARGATRSGAQGQFAASQGSGAPARRGNGRGGAGWRIRNRSRFRPSCRRQAIGLAPARPGESGEVLFTILCLRGRAARGLRDGRRRRGHVCS
jgi:hypothetical protein